MIGSLSCLRKCIIEGYGKETDMEKEGSGIGNGFNKALTPYDLLIQDYLLGALEHVFPDVEISVEEEIDNPSPAQRKLYKNDNSSKYLITIDPIDGTKGYLEGKNESFGVIMGIMKRNTLQEKEGEFIYGLIYYPIQDLWIKADEAGVYWIKGKKQKRIRKSGVKAASPYFSLLVHGRQKLHLPETIPIKRELYSSTQALRYLIMGKIPGFLRFNGYVNDSGVIAWIAKQWGADVEYARSGSFRKVPFGDCKENKRREPARVKEDLLIIGDREHSYYRRCKELYTEYEYQNYEVKRKRGIISLSS